MAGLVPAIHVARPGVGVEHTRKRTDVDARDKPGHDESGMARVTYVVARFGRTNAVPSSYGKLKTASMATENVFAASAADAAQVARIAVLDPAAGALMVRPAHDLKFRKAIRRKARRIKFKLNFS